MAANGDGLALAGNLSDFSGRAHHKYARLAYGRGQQTPG